MIDLPKGIAAAVGDRKRVQKRLGRSGDQVYSVGNDLYLKISADLPALRRERDIERWLEGKLSAPRVVEYTEETGVGYLLTTRVPGKPACHPQYLKDPERLCDLLAEAVALLRRVDAADCPFQSEGEGTAFVHGDCCLPNVMIYRGKISGFVDLGQAGRGDPWQDYAWCLWSLDYNLKTDAYRERLLQRLGIALDEEKYAKFLQ